MTHWDLITYRIIEIGHFQDSGLGFQGEKLLARTSNLLGRLMTFMTLRIEALSSATAAGPWE